MQSGADRRESLRLDLDTYVAPSATAFTMYPGSIVLPLLFWVDIEELMW